MHGIPLPRMSCFSASGPALELWHTMDVEVCEAHVVGWRWMGGDARARAAAGMAAAGVGPGRLGMLSM